MNEKAVSVAPLDARTALVATESGRLFRIKRLIEETGLQDFDEIAMPAALEPQSGDAAVDNLINALKSENAELADKLLEKAQEIQEISGIVVDRDATIASQKDYIDSLEEAIAEAIEGESADTAVPDAVPDAGTDEAPVTPENVGTPDTSDAPTVQRSRSKKKAAKK